jgi:hypothetical protein
MIDRAYFDAVAFVKHPRDLIYKIIETIGKYKLQIVGLVVVAVVTWVTYYPAQQIGFWFDDYAHLHMAGSKTLLEFWNSIFGTQDQRYFPFFRPIQQIQWRTEFTFFGAEAFGYHVVQNLYHFFNCLLLYAIVARLSRNWRMACIAALVYAVLPVYSFAVFYLGVADPLAGFFYLLAIWFWISYLETSTHWTYGLTLVSSVLALFSKEIALTLPITLVLIDRLMVSKPARWSQLAIRYLPILVLFPIWLLSDWNVLVEIFTRESSSNNWLGLVSNEIGRAHV